VAKLRHAVHPSGSSRGFGAGFFIRRRVLPDFFLRYRFCSNPAHAHHGAHPLLQQDIGEPRYLDPRDVPSLPCGPCSRQTRRRNRSARMIASTGKLSEPWRAHGYRSQLPDPSPCRSRTPRRLARATTSKRAMSSSRWRTRRKCLLCPLAAPAREYLRRRDAQSLTRRTLIHYDDPNSECPIFVHQN
jgi:hypothetical protein